LARSLTRRRRKKALNGSKDPVTVQRGALLFDFGHPCRRLYLLRSGSVQVSADHEAALDLLAPRAFLGQQCLLPAVRVTEVPKTVSRARLSAFVRSEARRRLFGDQRFALKLARSLARRLEGLVPPRPARGWARLQGSLSNPARKVVGTTRERVSHFLNEFEQPGWLRRDGGCAFTGRA
jgi:CRP-like cAMP-binding protein